MVDMESWNGAFCSVIQCFLRSGGDIPDTRNLRFYANKGFIAAHDGDKMLHRNGILCVTLWTTARCNCTLIVSIFAADRLLIRTDGSYYDIRKIRM